MATGLLPPGIDPQSPGYVGGMAMPGMPAPMNPVGELLSATNPVIGMLLQAASVLGINPYQLASAVTQDPEGAAGVLDGAGVPGPDAAAAAGGDPALGEALVGSQAAGPASIDLLPAEGGAGVVPGANTPGGQGGETLRSVLSGVVAPKPPTPPQLGTPGVPQPRGIDGPTLDALVQSALRVAQPQAQAMTLDKAIRR